MSRWTSDIKNTVQASGLYTDAGRRLFFQKYWHALLFPGYLVLAAIFALIEKYNMPKYWMSCSLDQFIPFVPAFVIPYILWFPVTAAALIALFFGDRKGFIKTIVLIYTGMVVSDVLFLLFPNGQPLRPIITDQDFFSRVVRFMIYANDTNTNCCPSLHVLNQTALHIGLCKSDMFRNNPKWKMVSLTATIFICASTCFIKQHSVIDVLVALTLEFILSTLFFKVDWSDFIGHWRKDFIRSRDLRENV